MFKSKPNKLNSEVSNTETMTVFFERMEPKILFSADALSGLVSSDPFNDDSANTALDINASVVLLNTSYSAETDEAGSDSNSDLSRTAGGNSETSDNNVFYDDLVLSFIGGDQANDDNFTSFETLSENNNDSASRQEIIFVDAATPNYQELLSGIESNAIGTEYQIFILQSGHDGVEQITEILARFDAVDAVHVVGHGNEQGIQLGDGWLSQDNVFQYNEAIQAWGDSLSIDADLLIYGCNLAASEDGQSLIQSLSELSGADVAASDDTTGHASLGGDWNLEFTTGAIETDFGLFVSAQQNWVGALATELPPTAEILVNSPDAVDPQETSALNRGSQQAVDMDANGNYVVVWSSLNQDGSGWGVFAQRFDALGTPQGSEFQVTDPLTDTDNQNQASVAMDDTGKFVVTWSSENQDGTSSSVYARQFNADGTVASAEFKVNTESSGSQSNSTLAMDAAGNFTIVWQGQGTGDNDGIFFRRFNADGSFIDATDQLANQTDDTAEHDPAIAMQTGGKFVIAWDEGQHIYFQRFDATGAALGSEIQIDGGLSTSSELAIDSNAAGDFTFVYREEGFLTGIWHRGFNEDGTEKYGYSHLATDDAVSPSIAMDAAGNHLVVYHKTGDGDGLGVYGEAYDSSGNSLGSAVQINETTTGSQQMASAALLDIDNYVVAWSGQGAADSDGVYARQFGTLSNAAPTADAGGPYTINEGDSLNLDASASTDPETDPLTYQWDLSYDGITFNAEATGITPNFNWAALQAAGIDDDGTYTIAVRADDGQGNQDIDQITLTVDNTAPVLSATGANTVTNGALYTLNLSAIDPGADTIASWTINWGDGEIETFAGNPSSVTHSYSNTGFTNNISVSATDEDNPNNYIHNDLFAGHYVVDAGVFRAQGDWGNLPIEFANEGTLDKAIQPIIGPDGKLYVSGEASKNVLRYDAVTGAFIDEFVTSGSGGLAAAGGITFGPDGHLYVSDNADKSVMKFDGTTGAYLGDFVPTASGGLSQPYSLVFGSDGNLYVSSYNNNEVLRYDGSSGAFIDKFVDPTDNGGLGKPEQMTFGPDGNLYIADVQKNNVLRFDGVTGAFIDKFVADNAGGLDNPNGIVFGPDGQLYVSDTLDGVILRYDGATGVFIDEYVTGLDKPSHLTFAPDLQVTVTGDPVFTSTGPLSVDENAATGIVVGDIDANDGNGGSNDAGITYSITTNVNPDADGNGAFVIDPNSGVITVNDSGDLDFEATNSLIITIQAADGTGQTSTDVTINLNDLNEAPTAAGVPSDVTVLEDTASNFDLSAVTFTDVDGDNLTVTLATSGGTFAASTSGGVTISGSGSSSLTLNGTVSNINTYLATTNNIRYTGVSNASGNNTATFTLNVNDGSVNPQLGNGNIDITAVNDIPTVTTIIPDQIASEDIAFTFTFAVNTFDDVDGDTLTYSSDASGWLSFDAATRTFSGTPLNADVGTTTVTVTANDDNGSLISDTFEIVISDTNDAPTVANVIPDQMATEDNVFSFAFAANTFNDIEGDVLTYTSDASGWLNFDAASRTFSGTPLNADVGITTVTVTADDGNGGLINHNFDIVINNTNDAPVAADTMINAIEDTFFNGTLPVATDQEGEAITYALGTTADNGTVIVNADGSFIYTPDSNYNGADSFTYTVSDINGDSNTYTVTVDVAAVNDAPVANNDTFTVSEGSTTTLYLIANDTDVDGTIDLASIVITSAPANGSIVVNTDGSVNYIHDGSDTVTDSFSYTILDNSGVVSNTGTLNLNVIDASELTVLISAETDRVIDALGTNDTEDTSSTDGDEEPVEATADKATLDAADGAVVESDTFIGSIGTRRILTLPALDQGDDDTGYRDTVIIRDNDTSTLRKQDISVTDRLRAQFTGFDGPLQLIATDSFISKLNDAREDIADENEVVKMVIGGSMSVSASVSVGYAVWMARSGVLMSGMLSSMPAWVFIDPLPVLAGMRTTDDEDDESLESMVEDSNQKKDKSKEEEKADDK